MQGFGFVRFSRPEGAAQAIREINNQVRGSGGRWRLAVAVGGSCTDFLLLLLPTQEFEGRKIRVSQAWQQTRY